MTSMFDEHDECTAETAITLLLMLALKTGHRQRQLVSGNGAGWSPTHSAGRHLSGKTLGLIGIGTAGLETARKAHFGFGMNIVIHDRAAVCDTVLDQVAAQQVDDIDHLLGLSDFVSLHCQPDAESRHLIDALRLNRMRPDACLINTASGQLVDEEALADALWYDTIAGAGLRVHHDEPAVSQRLLACENAVLLPQMTGTSNQRSDTAGHRVIGNLRDFHYDRAFCDRVA